MSSAELWADFIRLVECRKRIESDQFLEAAVITWGVGHGGLTF